jgi:hypothetical protein
MFSLFSLRQQATFHGPLNELKEKEKAWKRPNIYCSKRDGRIAVRRILENIVWANRWRKEIRSACWANLITTKKHLMGKILFKRLYDRKSSNRRHLEVVLLNLNYSHIELWNLYYFILYTAVSSGSKPNAWFNDDPFGKLKASNTLGAYSIECQLK